MNLCVLKTVGRAFTPPRTHTHLPGLISKVKQSSYSRQLQLVISILLPSTETASWACCLDGATGKYLGFFTLQKFQLLLVVTF